MNPKKRGKTFLNIIPKSRELLLHCTINEYFSEKELSNGCQALIESKFSIKKQQSIIYFSKPQTTFFMYFTD